jgi:hypothetical protein
LTASSSPAADTLAEIFAPLSPEESRRAIAAAVARLKGRRIRIYGAELRVEKPQPGRSRRPRPVRQITVLLADLAEYVPIEVVVDGQGAVRAVRERPELVPPFSRREIAAAIARARMHPDLGDLVERWGVEEAPFYPVARHTDHDGRPRGRRVGVHFLDTSDPASIRPVASVVVDLTTGQVETIERHRQRS